MARRGHHLTEVALLASAPGDLAAAGAGEREGWLDDPAVLPSLGPRARALAVASAARSVLVLVPIAGGGGVTVKPALGPDEGRISAVEWIPLAGEGAEGEEGVAVAVDTDAGWLLFYSLAGDLLHKQGHDKIPLSMNTVVILRRILRFLGFVESAQFVIVRNSLRFLELSYALTTI